MTVAIEVVPTTIETSRDISYEELESRLRRAAYAENIAAKTVQAIFSTILMQERWKEAALWLDPQTGVVYDTPYDAPDDVDLVKTDTPRFASSKEWTGEMEKLPFFARSTCYARHSEIVRQMRVLGRSFDAALNSVMLSRTLSSLMLDVVADETSGIFVTENVLSLLPPANREDAALDIEARGTEACREIVTSLMRENETRVTEGGEDIRQVAKDLRETISGNTKFIIRRHNQYPNAFVIYHESQGKQSQYVMYIEDKDNRIAPPEIVHYIARRLSVS